MELEIILPSGGAVTIKVYTTTRPGLVIHKSIETNSRWSVTHQSTTMRLCSDVAYTMKEVKNLAHWLGCLAHWDFSATSHDRDSIEEAFIKANPDKGLRETGRIIRDHLTNDNDRKRILSGACFD